MSVRVMAKVWEFYPGGGTELLALLALADWSDDDGRCFPSINSIANKIRLKERQAQRAVNKLINDGFVKVLSNKFGGAPGSTRKYQIIISNLTGVTDDTPKQVTGVINGIDGCHIAPETGVTDDTLTTIEPSIEPPDIKRKNKTLKNYLEECKAKSKKPIPEDSKVFEFSERANIPIEFLTLAWNDFKEKFIDDEVKKQKDWVLTFTNYVKNNWLDIWYFNKENACLLTSKGIGLQNYYKNKVDV